MTTSERFDRALSEAAEPFVAAQTERDSLFQRVLTATGSEETAALAVARAAGASGSEAVLVAVKYLELRQQAAGKPAA